MPRVISKPQRVHETRRGPQNLPRIVYLLILAALFISTEIHAGEWGENYATRYSTVYYRNDSELYEFTKDIGSGFDFFMTRKLKTDPDLTGKKIDAIVERVFDILGMHVKGLNFKIYIHSSQGELSDKYRGMGYINTAPIAFYWHRDASVHVSLETVNAHILSHEIGHVVINAYFPIPPPPEMQEILTRYVDAHLWDK